jgi:hypothetical protein
LGVTVETWVVKDPSKIEEHDRFFMKWMEYVVTTLGKSAPSHKYFSQRNPVGGRIFVINFNSDEDERKLDKMLVEEKTFAKFRDEWKIKYAPESFVVCPCDEIMQDAIKEIENKHR